MIQTLKMVFRKASRINALLLVMFVMVRDLSIKLRQLPVLPAMERAILTLIFLPFLELASLELTVQSVKVLDTLYRTHATFVVVLDVFCLQAKLWLMYQLIHMMVTRSEYLEWEMQEQMVLQPAILS